MLFKDALFHVIWLLSKTPVRYQYSYMVFIDALFHVVPLLRTTDYSAVK